MSYFFKRNESYISKEQLRTPKDIICTVPYAANLTESAKAKWVRDDRKDRYIKKAIQTADVICSRASSF